MSALPDLVTCPLCGKAFPRAAACAPGCPLSASCRTLCCPNCHYRFVESSMVADWLRRLLSRTRR